MNNKYFNVYKDLVFDYVGVLESDTMTPEKTLSSNLGMLACFIKKQVETSVNDDATISKVTYYYLAPAKGAGNGIWEFNLPYAETQISSGSHTKASILPIKINNLYSRYYINLRNGSNIS